MDDSFGWFDSVVEIGALAGMDCDWVGALLEVFSLSLGLWWASGLVSAVPGEGVSWVPSVDLLEQDWEGDTRACDVSQGGNVGSLVSLLCLALDGGPGDEVLTLACSTDGCVQTTESLALTDPALACRAIGWALVGWFFCGEFFPTTSCRSMH